MIRGISIAAAAALLSTAVWAQEPKETPAAGGGPVAGLGNGVAPGVQTRGTTFGYTVSDSAGGACAFDFIDISGTGASIVTGDDAESAPVPIPTDFDFYGAQLGSVVMATNGFLSTDTGSAGDLSNDCPLPATPSTGTGARIYAVHDDLITTDGYYEYFATCPRASDQFPFNGLGCHIFQWSGVTHFGGGGPWDFQVILYDESYEIVVQSGAGNPETGSGSTTGLQNAAATDGLTYACDVASSIPDNSSQCFVHPAPAAVGIGATAVPTMNHYGLIATILALMALGGVVLVRRAG